MRLPTLRTLATPCIGVALAHLFLATQTVAQERPSPRFWWADYDADGREDALVLTPNGEARLLRNLGDGDLADATREAGLPPIAALTLASWEDIDRDGDIDLLVGTPTGPCRLFLNTAGTFQEMSETAGLDHQGEDLRFDWLDYDGDGLPDLSARTQDESLLYRNLGEGVFERVELGLPVVGPAQGIAVTELPVEEEPPAQPEPEDTSASARTTGSRRVLVDVSSFGLQPSAVVPPASPVDLIAGCVNAIRDDAKGNCLGASSVPQLGRLYPLSTDFYVDPATGFVGLGTTSPSKRLHVAGTMEAVTGNGAAITALSHDSSGGGFGLFAQGAEAGLRAQPLSGIGTWAELGTQEGYGIHASGTDKAGLFNGEVRVNGDLRFGPTGRIGLTNYTPFSPAGNIHVGSTFGVELVLEADHFNFDEAAQPSILFSQDGDLVQTRVGFQDADNHFVIRNFFDAGGLRFDLNTSSDAHWEFRRRTTSGGSDVEARLTRLGHLQIDGSVSSPAADLAEYYPVQGVVEPGDVVAFGDGGTLASASARERGTLAGIVSSDPAFIMGLSYSVEEERPADGKLERPVAEEIQLEGRAPLALAGRVPCKVTAENGRIRPGDLLTVSSLPGHAAKAVRSGPVVGTALEAWDAGHGTIEVFVNVGWFSPNVDDRLRRLETEVSALREALEAR